MRVREVRKISDRKAMILFEDGSSFPLYLKEIRKYGIRPQEDLPDGTIRRILEEVLKKRSRLRCMNLLRTSDRTVSELRRRLVMDGYPEDTIRQALDYVASFHYTDDRRYARNYILQMSGRKSLKQIEYELLGRGVDRETVRAALAQEEACAGSMEADAIRSLARRRGFCKETAEYRDWIKFQRYLLGKGFGYEAIRETLGPAPDMAD